MTEIICLDSSDDEEQKRKHSTSMNVASLLSADFSNVKGAQHPNLNLLSNNGFSISHHSKISHQMHIFDRAPPPPTFSRSDGIQLANRKRLPNDNIQNGSSCRGDIPNDNIQNGSSCRGDIKRRKISQQSNAKSVSDNLMDMFRRFGRTFNVACVPKNNSAIVNDEEFTGLFKCSYNNCGKHVKNNVAMIWHLWAHCVQQKPTECEEMSNLQIFEAEDDEEKTDVKRLHICPKCLIFQPTPYRLHLHYHRAHTPNPIIVSKSVFTCNICEQMIGEKDMSEHIQRHRPFGDKKLDLPYLCRFKNGSKHCSYRFSTRMALVEHFCRLHQNTFVLLCPFCLQTFFIPVANRKNSIVNTKDYARHVLQHDTEKTKFCGGCAARFTPSNAVHFNNHLKKNHSQKTERKGAELQQTTKQITDIKLPKSVPINRDLIFQRCLECRKEIKSLREHYTVKKRNCANCSFGSHCGESFARHLAFGNCNTRNGKQHFPLGRRKKAVSIAQKFVCSKCAFSTLLVQKIAEHIHCCAGSRIILHKQSEENITEEEKIEANLFCLIDGSNGEIAINRSARISNNASKNDGSRPETKGGGRERSVSLRKATTTTINKNDSLQKKMREGKEGEEVKERRLAQFLPPFHVDKICNNKMACKYLLGKSSEKSNKFASFSSGQAIALKMRLALQNQLSRFTNK